MKRRDFLLTGLGAMLAGRIAPACAVAAVRGRAVVVGGGWGGLAAARELRRLAPQLEVTLVERHAAFESLPLSNQWLTGRVDGRLLRHDYARAATAYGYRFVQAEVQDIDRARRRVAGADFSLDYDWLVLAPGIRHDYAAWFGGDARAAEEARRRFSPAWTTGGEVAALKQKLAAFAGGDFVMTIPPAPYRCPPAPYERALVVAESFRKRGIKARLIVLDANGPSAAFSRTFAEQYRQNIVYMPHSRVGALDPFAQTITTTFDEFRFADAVLMPPQRAGELAERAGVVGKDGWAAVDPLHFAVPGDARVFVVGDAIGPVSSLFGHYPKSGHMAAVQGRIAAAAIAARAAGREPEAQLPESTCHVMTRLDPPEALRIDLSYRRRGDGLVVQSTQQTPDPNPRGEDVAWAKTQFAELLAYSD